MIQRPFGDHEGAPSPSTVFVNGETVPVRAFTSQSSVEPPSDEAKALITSERPFGAQSRSP